MSATRLELTGDKGDMSPDKNAQIPRSKLANAASGKKPAAKGKTKGEPLQLT